MRRSPSLDCPHYIGLGAQGAGIAAFVTTVVGYTLVNRMLSSPWYGRSSSSRGIRAMDAGPAPTRAALGPSAAGPAGAEPAAAPALPYKVGLLDLTVPSKRSPGYTNLLLANDICIERAVQSVSDTLYVYLQEDPQLPSSSTTSAIPPLASASASPASSSAASSAVSPTAPELRVYLSELYGQLWDVCYLHRNLQLDVRIIYNTTSTDAAAAATGLGGGGGKKKKGLSPFSKKNKKASGGGAAGGGEGGGEGAVASGSATPTTREEALLKPELDVVFSRKGPETERANAKRAELGLPPVALEWLDDRMKVAMETPFFYLEDEQCHIPHFPRVAVGGTFDRLHNGHKKLLTLAACVCQSCLTIGITSAEMLAKKKNADQIEPLEDRVAHVRAFLGSVFPDLELNIVVLTDPFGPPAHEPDFDAIVVSSETIAGAAKINEMRAAQGFRPLTVVVTRRTVSSLLSSTFIRNNLPPRQQQQRRPSSS